MAILFLKHTRLLIGLTAVCCLPTGCTWWKAKIMGDEQAAEERMTEGGTSPFSESRSLTPNSARSGGWSAEARAIERNLGVN